MWKIWTDIHLLAERLRIEKATVYSPRVVVTSGPFDPLHFGHVKCLEDSKRFGEILVVVMNGDGFLLRKKGYVFMPREHRLGILAALACVDYVVEWDDCTQYVDKALEILKPDVFTKGGDRTPDNMSKQEISMCEKISCRIEYSVGGGKLASSSELVNRCKNP